MQLVKQLSTYTFVSFLGAGINFFLMPYLSHFINPAEYGILSILNTFVSLIIPLVGLVATSIITVEYYKLKDKREFASLFSSVQLIPIIPAIISLVITVLFRGPLCRFLELPESEWHWLPISVLLAVFTIYYETLLMFNVAEKKPVHYAVFNIVKLSVEVSLTIWFVSGLGMGWEGRMWSWVISTALLGIVSFFYFNQRGLLTKKISKNFYWAGIIFGLPLILHTIGKFVINQSNRIFIAKLDSVEEAGIYNVGAQVGMVILLLVNAIGNFYQPYLYERLTNLTHAAKLQIVKMTYTIMLGLMAALVALTVLAHPFFKYLVDEKYFKATRYVFWVGLGYFFWGVYILFTGFVFYQKQTNFLGVLAIINVSVSIALNYWLISVFGPLGAAYASALSFLIVAFMVIWKANRLFPLPWLSFRKAI